MRKSVKDVEKSNSLILDIEHKQLKIKVLNIIILLILLIMAVIFVLPILWLLVSAFKDTREFIMNPPTIIPQSFQPYKLFDVWKKANFGTSYLITTILGFLRLIASVIISGLAGYALSRLKPRGSKVLMTLVLWTMMMPGTMNMVPLFQTFLDFPILHVNMTNTFWPFVIMQGASCFYLLLFKSFFDGIPSSYLEAARMDGSTEIGNYFRIILPLSKPVVFTIAIFILNSIWGDFLWPLLLFTAPDMQTTGLKLYTFKADASIDEQFVAMLFVIFPSVVMYLGFHKYLSEGISLGGIKG